MLSEYLRTIGSQKFEYIGDCWGNHHYTATAAQFADDVTAIGYDGPIIDHPAYGGDSDGYYIQSGDIWQYTPGHGQELVLKRKRKHNPAWPDPPEARAKRQAKRLARLNEVAQSLSFPTWRRLETAALRGDVVLTVTHSDSKVYILMTDGAEYDARQEELKAAALETAQGKNN